MTQIEKAETDIVEGLTGLILIELKRLSSECWEPKFMSDRSDAEIKFRRNRIKELRQMRHDFENAIVGVTDTDLSQI